MLARELNNLLVTLLAALLGEKDGVDVGEDTTLGNGHTSKELGQLLEDLSGQVLKDGSQVHGGTGTNALCKMKEKRIEEKSETVKN